MGEPDAGAKGNVGRARRPEMSDKTFDADRDTLDGKGTSSVILPAGARRPGMSEHRHETLNALADDPHFPNPGFWHDQLKAHAAAWKEQLIASYRDGVMAERARIQGAIASLRAERGG